MTGLILSLDSRFIANPRCDVDRRSVDFLPAFHSQLLNEGSGDTRIICAAVLSLLADEVVLAPVGAGVGSDCRLDLICRISE
jgi:hypothetical protein